jgi:protein gp37
MNKSKIEWCDYTWNPVTGCLHGCDYCYAKRIANRFNRGTGEGVNPTAYYEPTIGIYIKDDEEKNNISNNNHIHVVKRPMYDEWIVREGEYNHHYDPYPYGFEPTFHKYRLDEPARKTKGQKIFVCSMADLFGDWVPDEWIEEVFEACKKAPQHKYLFLTKNPSRYWQLHDKGILPQHNNYWYGTTLTHSEDEHEVANNLPAYTGLPKPTFRNTFVSAEPILDNIEGAHPMGGFFTYYPHTIKWAILGAETGSRKGKVIPRRKWIESIVSACHKADVPVFMKNSLKDLMGDDFIQEWPEGLR